MFSDYTGHTYLSSSKYEAWVKDLSMLFSLASRPIAPFSKLLEWFEYDHLVIQNAWRGLFVYTGVSNILSYTIEDENTNGLTELVVNGSVVASWDGISGAHNGTVTLAGLSAGSAYEVIVRGQDTSGNNGASVQVHWLGITNTVTYTVPPTFANASTVSYTDLSDLVDCMNEIAANRMIPSATFPYHQETNGHPNDTPIDIWIGNIVHTHNTLKYRIFNDSGSSDKIEMVFYINGIEVGTERGQDRAEGSINITAQGLTLGSKYEIKVAARRYDSASIETSITGIIWLVEENTLESIPDQTILSRDEVFNDADLLNWFSDVSKSIHPLSPTKTVPMFYESPIVKVSPQGKWYWRRSKNNLYYKHDGSEGTVELLDKDGNSLDTLSSGDIQIYDFGNSLPNHYIGLEIQGDDADYMQEYS